MTRDQRFRQYLGWSRQTGRPPMTRCEFFEYDDAQRRGPTQEEVFVSYQKWAQQKRLTPMTRLEFFARLEADERFRLTLPLDPAPGEKPRYSKIRLKG